MKIYEENNKEKNRLERYTKKDEKKEKGRDNKKEAINQQLLRRLETDKK